MTDAKAVGGELGIAFLTLGMSPLWTRAETPVMPKARYRIMTNYMPKVGKLGLDMMYRTSTVQVNMDYESEADMVKKLRVSLALQPVATAIFANSPFTDGKPNGYLSMRSEIWRDTDRDRTGMMDFAFEDGFGYEAYVEWALGVPMYFIKRGSVYHDVAGASFKDLLAGKLSQFPGERATQSDWANHVSTIFPEVRLKRYLEMRGADVGATKPHRRALGVLDRTPLRHASARCRLGFGEGLERGGSECCAGGGAETRSQGGDRRPFAARCRARRVAIVSRWPAKARPSRR